MDGFKKNHSSSPSTKLSATPKLSSPDLQPRTCYSNDVVMNNENDQSAHQMGSKLQSPKHFMSHTFSTASKAASAKKVLGERNEQSGAIISATHVEKSPVSNSRVAYADVGYNDLDRYSRLTPKISYRVSDLDQENISASDPSSQPYDPLTNYLSPRPKFLRYRPNRRHEFLLNRENEGATEENGHKSQESIEGEESNQSVDADGSSSSSSAKGFVEPESNSSDDDEDMEEFEVDEKHWDFNKVFKSLFLLGILILSTMFISSMNSPTPPPFIQALQEVRECYQKTQAHLFRVTMVSNFLDQERENSLSVTTNRNETVTPGGSHEEEMIFSMKETWENSYLVAEELELQQLENEAQSVPDSQTQFMSHWVDNQIAGSDIFNSFEIQKKLDEGTEPVMAEQEKKEYVTEASGGASNGGTLTHEIDLWREFVKKWMEEVENVSGKTSKMLEPLDGENTEISQVSQTQMISGAKAIEHPASDDIHITDGTKVDVDEEDQIKGMKSEFIARAAVVVSVIAISVVFGLLHIKNRRTIKGSHLRRAQSSSESVKVETRGSELPPSESMAKVDSLINLSPSVPSDDKAFKELHQSGVPKVELLGEFTMGEIRRSSIKSCDLKYKKVEGEVTNFSAPQDKRPRRKIPSSVNDIRLSPAVSSATEFSSYGSFTAPENIVKKEEGNEGEEEVRKIIRTPVRRSNRIRNRVTSP
ncbi:uncharacterized protein LOC122082323 [Macadamia integrifolia]|uniref:uncharacterized protein LOC122082323 n=1 Tax=Macadamia integrifolia TaxID=60698 RepID=UPI001C4F8747|nr:uncharacterized protein LOC122082323 [Macadamia integrifolia]